MKRLALIPARSGSKRLPGKNMALLGGKPLIGYTIEAVIAADCYDAIVVSSDDPELLAYASLFPCVTTVPRRPDLATDTARTIEVVLDYLEQLSPLEIPKLCGLFPPTTPFRNADDIEKATLIAEEGEIDTVVSITALKYPPEFSINYDATTRLCAIDSDSPLRRGRTQVQRYEQRFGPNGAIYIAKVQSLLSRRSFFEGRIAGYPMPPFRSLDIDTKEDWLLAECILATDFTRSTLVK